MKKQKVHYVDPSISSILVAKTKCGRVIRRYSHKSGVNLKISGQWDEVTCNACLLKRESRNAY